jgi:hypothetical protein
LSAARPRTSIPGLREIVLAFETAGVEFLVHGTRIVVLPPLSTLQVAIAAD